MSKIIKMAELVDLLNQYRHEYYNLAKPTVSDSKYDKLFDELKQLENEIGIAYSNSPTQTVGYNVVSKLQKVTHSIPLKSLDKTKSIDELKRWRGDKDILAMIKADGLTVELIYNEGKLVQGSTRGNGEIGEDITHNISSFKGVPLTIPFKGYLKIAGEAVIHKNDFDDINSKLPDDEKKYTTPRNLVSGSVRQLDSGICSERYVFFYAFNVVETSYQLPDSKYEVLGWLGNLGFCIIAHANKRSGSDIQQSTIDMLKETAEQMEIPIDGLVFSFDSREYSATLGETSHHPLHSIAFKFEDEIAETTLIDIEWSVGRTGQITPVAIFDTVILDNTEVSRASLHNISIIEDLELGIGDRVGIQKCNLIIPQIADNYTRSNNIIIPNICPACGEKAVIEQLNSSKMLKCTNELCSAVLLGKFTHFVSRDAMNIDGLSEATLEKFISAGFIKTFDDIYKLENFRYGITNMAGFGVKSFDKLISAIEKSKKVKMSNFLYALGIPTIGRSASKTISKYFGGDWWKFESAIGSFDFTQLEDFGQTMHDNIYKWYTNALEQLMWAKVVDILEFEKVEIKPVDSNLKDLTGITFVVTGNVATFKNRKELEDLILSLNGKLAGSVSAKTNYLINNDTTSTSGKNQKAQQLNIPIISEVEFNNMIGRN